MLSEPTIEKATRMILDAVSVMIEDDPDLVAAATKGVLVYEYMREDGSVGVNVFGTLGMWTAETIGYLMIAQHMLLEQTREDD